MVLSATLLRKGCGYFYMFSARIAILLMNKLVD